MMSMRSKQPPSSTPGSGPSRYDRMAAPGHVTKMNAKVNWSEFAEEKERVGSSQLPAISAGGDLNNSYRKRTPLSTADLATSDRFTILPEIEGIDIDKELCESLSGPLKDVSRQRLRAIKIGFRRLSGMDSRVAMKDVLVVLGEHNVKISNRTYQMILRKFETDRGMDTDGLWKYMVEAQARTGRDSIQAINQNKQAASQPTHPLEAEDIALLASISKALKSSNEYDLDEMRSICQMRDISRHGLLPRKMFRRICLDQHIPLGAALMRTMLKRCDDKNNGLISWPEFLMLLEKGVNFDNDKYRTKRRTPATPYKPHLSHKKPASPMSQARLLPNGAKSRDGKEGGKGKGRPQTNDLSASQAAKSRNNADGSDSKSADAHSKEDPSNAATAPTTKSPESPVGQGSKAKDEKSRANGEDRGVVKATDPSGQKGKSKDAKATGKPKEKVQNEEDTLSVKSLPSQRKGKSITWNDPIAVPPRADQSQASSEPDQSPTASENDEASKPLPPSDRVEIVDSKSMDSPLHSEPSTDLEQTQGAVTDEASDQITNADESYVDATEQEYLKKQQQNINRAGSEITLNEQNSEYNSSLSSHQKEKVDPLKDPDNPASPDDNVSDVISLAPSDEKTDCKPGEHEGTVSNASPSTEGKHDLEELETSSVCDKDNVDAQSVMSLSLCTKSKAQKPSAISEKKMRSVYGKNPRKSVAPLDKKDKEKRTTPSKTSTNVKAPASRKSGETKSPKTKSSPASGKVKKENRSVPAPASSEVDDQSKHEVQEPDTTSIFSQTSADSQEVEKTDDSILEGALTLPNDDAKEEAGPPATQREEDGEAATFTIQGQEVSYYKPDAYAGEELSADAPSQSLQIDWIYGYRGNDCRCNMYVVEDGVLAYFIGKVAVLYDTEKHSQRHYVQHTAEIKSLAVHSSNVILVTGQTAGPDHSSTQACIHVWSVETLETLYVAGEGYFQGAVLCLSFCKDEDYLVAVDDSDEHTMSVWHSSSGERLAEKMLLTEVVCQVAFDPIHPHQLVSIGKEHLCFWRLLKDPYTIEETMIANFETKMKAKYVICLAFHPNGSLLTGDSNGTIYVWHKDSNTIAHTITHAHKGPVFWLMYVKSTLLSGGRDGIIQAYSLSPKGTDYTGKLQLPTVEGGVRTIQIHGNRMYIGTTLNCILSANITSSGTGPQITGATINNAPITQGHYDEVRCIAPHSAKKDHFFTAAYDGIVCLYDAGLHKAIWKYVVKGINTTCLDVSPNGEVIILGAKDGHLVVLTVGEEEVQETNRIKLGRLPVSFIKFAPGGKLIATSCGDIILILRMVDNGQTIEPMGKCQGHLTAVTGFDWSKEEISGRLLLQSSSLNHEYLCWDVETFQALDFSSDYRNVSWNSHNCGSGFTVSGVWGASEDSSEVNSVDWSEDLELLVTASDDGLVNLYKYPCANQQPSCRSVFAHCRSAPCVRFLPGGSRMVLSAGGLECTTIQWTIQG